MTLKEQMVTDMAVFFDSDEFADAATYVPVNWQPGDAEEVSCNVLVDHDVLIQGEGYDMNLATLGTTIMAKVADVGTLERGDTFEVGDDTWTVQRIEENDGSVVRAVVK